MEVKALFAVLSSLVLSTRGIPMPDSQSQQQGQPQRLLVQQNQPEQPQQDQQVVVTQGTTPVLVNQQGQPVVYVQTLQPGQQVYQQPQQLLVAQQQPNREQALIFQQPPNQQQILVGQQSNQQPILVSQPGQQTIWVTPQGQQAILVNQPNQVTSPNIAGQTVVTNGNQAILVTKPNGNVYTLIPINNQNINQNPGASNDNTVLIPVQQVQQG